MPAASRVLCSIAKKIHPQLPLTPRESQQLHRLLTASFNKNLDKAHPPPLQETSDGKDTASKQAATWTSNQSSAQDMEQDEHLPVQSSSTSANAHLSSVLTHPLLAVSPLDRGQPAMVTSIPHHALQDFKRRVALGSADFQAARECLMTIAEHRQKFHGRDSTDNNFGASKVVEWLLSTYPRLELRERTSSCGRELDVLIAKTLVSEGRTDVLLQYLHRVCRLDSEDFTATDFERRAKRASAVLATSISICLQQGCGTSCALDLYLKIAQYFTSLTRINIPYKTIGLYTPLPAAAQLVSHFARYSPVPASLEKSYEGLIRSLEKGERTPRRQFTAAELWLYHPTRPTVEPGLHYIRRQMRLWSLGIERTSRYQRRQVVRVSLLLVRALMEKERYDEANEILHFVKAAFARELNLSESTDDTAPQPSRAPSWLDSMNLLDKMTLD